MTNAQVTAKLTEKYNAIVMQMAKAVIANDYPRAKALQKRKLQVVAQIAYVHQQEEEQQ